MSVADPLALWLRPDEQCVALADGFRLIQRLRGHRYSVDDMLVGQLACTACPAPRRVLDLGCGIGSVLLTEAWAWPDATLVGVEAQPEHVSLAQRNIVLNDCEQRVSVVEGDLRDEQLIDGLGTFDVVTATPPYFDPAAATPCADKQRAYAQFELRGGIEAYAAAAARALAPGGRLVACASALRPERARDAFERAGLGVAMFRDVLPRPDKPPFLQLLLGVAGPAPTRTLPPLVLRLANGQRSEEHIALREWSGIACGVW